MTNLPTESNSDLRKINYPLIVETSTDDLITDFYTPSLESAIEYKRAVGYLTGGWFAEAAKGISELANRGGTAKWIISPKLTEQDWEAIKQGSAAKRDPHLYSRMEELTENLETNLETETQNTLAWLIADGLLQLKIAVTDDGLNGDFHDKWGIFIDDQGNKVAFHGSQNDSRQSLSNYEANSIFTSWRSEIDKKRVNKHETRFDELWADSKSGVKCFSLPDSVSLGIAELRDSDRPYENPDEGTKLTSPYRWRHQEEAVEAFLEAESGILEMATGTGKTRTSLKIVDQLLRKDKINTLVVATYGNDLLNQWEQTLLDHFSTEEILLYQHFGGDNELASYFMTNTEKLDILLTSYANLSNLVDNDTSDKLSASILICDEVHNIGAKTKREELGGELDAFNYRLGLSATPFDPYNEDRNEFIRNEVGEVCYEFTLKNAIERGILCEFDYEPLHYELSADDKEKQKDAYSKFAGLKQQNPSIPKSQLYILLARVRKESKEKLPVFEEHLENNASILDSCIIFVETKDYGLKVQEIIYDYVDEYHTYYGEDDEAELDKFSDGELSTLITSRAISEGIDIQSVKNIILFTAPRSKGTTIQRIGRALRKDPDNPSKNARITDFVVGSDVSGEISDGGDDEMTPPDKERYDWLEELSDVNQLE